MPRVGMAVCTRGAGPWRVWHPSGVGLDLHPWVHPHPTQGGSGRGCEFQSAPADPHSAPVYSPCTTILGPEIRGHTKPTPRPAPKPAGTRNPQAPKTCPETRGHSMANALSKLAGTQNPPGTSAGAVFHPQVRMRVFTHRHFGAGRGFGQPAPLPSLASGI
jgi:hypothetical protein